MILERKGQRKAENFAKTGRLVCLGRFALFSGRCGSGMMASYLFIMLVCIVACGFSRSILPLYSDFHCSSSLDTPFPDIIIAVVPVHRGASLPSLSPSYHLKRTRAPVEEEVGEVGEECSAGQFVTD